MNKPAEIHQKKHTAYTEIHNGYTDIQRQQWGRTCKVGPP